MDREGCILLLHLCVQSVSSGSTLACISQPKELAFEFMALPGFSKEKPALCFAFPPTHLYLLRFSEGIKHAKLMLRFISLSFKTEGILRGFSNWFLS